MSERLLARKSLVTLRNDDHKCIQTERADRKILARRFHMQMIRKVSGQAASTLCGAVVNMQGCLLQVCTASLDDLFGFL